jgi:hypothetical protein
MARFPYSTTIQQGAFTMRSPSAFVLLACGLLLTCLFSEVRPTAAQAEEDCFRPEGVGEAPTPSITAAEVAADPTPENIKAFALEARNYGEGLDQTALSYAICHFKQEGNWKSGSIYVTSLTFLAGGRVEIHAGDMAFGGRKVREDVFMAAAAAAGYNPDTQTFTNPDGGALPEELGGYAVGMHVGFGPIQFPLILTAGLDLQETHLVPEVFDPADAPAVTASDVVDRETLKAFVNGAIDRLGELFVTEGFGGLTKGRAVFRAENGPWREGSVYLYTLDASGYTWFHGAFPHRYEFTIGGRATDAVTGEVILDLILEAAQSDTEGGFIEYHFDDPDDDSDSAEIPKTAFVRQHTYPGFPLPFIFGSGFYGTTGAPDTMTQFVPVVLDAGGKNNSHFTSELALTNRGSDTAMLNFTYTAEAGGGSGAATDMLGPHQQRIASNAIEYLRGLEVPIPETGSRIGTLRVDVSGSSDVSTVVRTTTPTAVPEGRAGLAYLGIGEQEGFHEEVVYLCGLRDNPGDRSNVAVQNMGSDGSITVRITAFSGNPTDPAGQVAWEDTLEPGEFHQVNTVLTAAGKADPMFGGYVSVERVEGMAPFYAYGVINDNANSDGSFVFPVSADSLMGAMGQTLPAIVETGAFTTELTLTNFSDQQKAVLFSATHERIDTPDNTAGFGPVPMLPGQQLIIPHALAYARQNLGLNVPMGLVAPLIASPVAGDLSGVVIGARVVAQADSEDMTQGQYGVFYTAVPQGMGFTQSAWVDGLQQNEENRANLALINTGEVDDQDIVFEIDIYDGETATLSQTVTMAEEDKLVVPAKGFQQINQVLKLAPGTTQGYIRIRKVSGANPFLAYGVVNDGGAPGERTGDGAYIPARE